MTSKNSPPGPEDAAEVETDSFLNRWSSRKRSSQTAASPPSVAVAGDSASHPGPSAAENPSFPFGDRESPLTEDAHSEHHTLVSESTVTEADNDEALLEVAETEAVEDTEPLLSDDDMPPVQSLDADSDMQPFFNPGVSKALRRAALRHVFSLPIYNVRDGLNDYDEDYTVFEPLGDTVTADMKFHAARKERDRLEALRKAEEEERLAAEREEEECTENDGEVAEETEAPEDEDIPAESEPGDEMLADGSADSPAEPETDNASLPPSGIDEDSDTLSTENNA